MKLFRISISIFLIIIALLLINYFVISSYSNAHIFKEVDKLPAYNSALILGAGKNHSWAPENFAFTGRMKATIELFNNHHALEKIIVSGMNYEDYCDEPNEMRIYLVKFGVTDSIILMDYEGTRTLKSILSAKNNIIEQNLIIVSQKEHLQRAVFIANALDIKSVGYEAKDLPQGMTIKLYSREVFARLKCTFEILKYKLLK